jgi:8-oxo-dGTP pyrophosphatase MutT (NUDIX family)
MHSKCIMKSKENILSIVDLYKKLFSEEKELLKLDQFLYHNQDLYGRKNFDGHITSSAFILNEEFDHILLIHHPILRQWFQPGGHVESSDGSILDGSIRELTEETPVRQFNQLMINDSAHIPLDIDSHYIPANPNKNEAEHFHHDFRYLFICKEELKLSEDLKWISLEAFSKIEDYQKTSTKLISFIDKMKRPIL